MSVKVTDHTLEIDGNITRNANIFLRTFADEVIRAAEPNTPKDKGNLRRDVVRQVLGLRGKIVWGKNYSVFQELKQFRNYTTPGTGPHFAENAVKATFRRANSIARKVGFL